MHFRPAASSSANTYVICIVAVDRTHTKSLIIKNATHACKAHRAHIWRLFCAVDCIMQLYLLVASKNLLYSKWCVVCCLSKSVLYDGRQKLVNELFVCLREQRRLRKICAMFLMMFARLRAERHGLTRRHLSNYVRDYLVGCICTFRSHHLVLLIRESFVYTCVYWLTEFVAPLRQKKHDGHNNIQDI